MISRSADACLSLVYALVVGWIQGNPGTQGTSGARHHVKLQKSLSCLLGDKLQGFMDQVHRDTSTFFQGIQKWVPASKRRVRREKKEGCDAKSAGRSMRTGV